MKVTFGYDVMTYNGELPNCLNPKFYNTIYQASDFDFNKSRDAFNEIWESEYPVFNSNDLDRIAEKKLVSQIIDDRKNGDDYKWFYLVEPHSGLDLFFGNHNVHNEFILNYMSQKAIHEIKVFNGNLLINYIVDGGIGITTDNFKKIVEFTRFHNIPDEKVYFIFSDFRLKENLKKLDVNYKVFDFNFYLFFKANEFNTIAMGTNTQSTIRTKENYINSIEEDKKDFLVLTRHWKLHRIYILNKIHRLGLDNSLVSWESSFFSEHMINFVKQYDDNQEFFDMLQTSKYVDVEDLVSVWGYGSEQAKIYNDTYLSVVTESMFFQEDVNFPTGFISEKIWKPIGHCQPFILAGPAGTLKYIRERFNFKTFHPFIDETYDSVEDDLERVNLICSEIEKFSNKTKEEKIQFLKDVQEICFYNQKLFLSLDGEFANKLLENPELWKIYKFLKY